MIETPHWHFDIEVKPADWHFPASPAWIAGWLWSPENRVTTDLRLWIDGRPFLSIPGLPKPGLDERFLHRPGPPYLGFTILVTAHAGASLLRLEVRDQTGSWCEIFRTAITVADDARPCPPQSPLPSVLGELVPALLKLSGQRLAMPLPALADELLSAALSEPLNSLPNPPFHGALEEPRTTGWVRYGRLSITGWLAHRHHAITHLTAMVDPLLETPLLHGLPRTDVDDVFADLPGRERSAFVGHVDLPADTAAPVLLKIFAALSDGTKHLVFAQRFTPRIIAGADVPLPRLSRLTFARAVWALLGSAGRHGVARGRWAELRPVLAAAWSAYAAEAPAPAGRARLAPAAPLTAHAGRALRVLVATHNLNFEGAPWFIFELARHLATLPGVTVRIVSPQAGPMGAVFEQAGMPVQMLDLAAAFAAPDPAAFQAALLAATRPIDWSATDLVIANTMVSFWAVHAARQAGKTSLLYIHESAAIRRFFAPLLAPALFPVVEEAFRLAARVVFTADATRIVHAHLGDRGNFTLLPSWVDVARVDAFIAASDPASLRRKHGLDPAAVQVVNIGSVCERKGQHVFIRALDLLKTELGFTYPGKKIQFVMVGARPGLYLDSLRQEISLLGLDDIALFMPETGDIFDFYRLADIFVCTSFEESFPRVLLESAAFGLPVVTTNVNGIPEMLAADEAWHTPPGDRYRLAEAIKLALAAHFAGDRSRVEKARATVLRKYHEAHSLPRHARLARAAAQHR
jgi:glycosyltransferase involved in cell wall biosynthesis